MKLHFKTVLTRKCLPDSDLEARLNWSMGLLAVLPSSNLGEGHARSGSKQAALPLPSVRTERRRGVAGAEWHPRESPGSSLSTAGDAAGAPLEIVPREEVRQRLWPENTFVEFDNSLGVAIRKVRDALNDDADTPRYVETLPRRGYRFVAPATALETVQSPDPPPPAALVTKESSASSRIGATEAAHPHHRRKYC